ncbi:MAG: lysylphosphatidylglycerol synthase transmembrane domain-containing protein [Dehalococcoidia bacterium]|nr:lysylphosphatidylglycerol synthase transmembrane domain-containing protein [Dehalococcoidia bacterium]
MPGTRNAEEISLRRRFFSKRTLVSFAIAFGIIVFVVLRLDISLSALWQDLTQADLLMLLAGFASYYLALPVRAIRWRIILNNATGKSSDTRMPSLLGLGEIILLGWLANNIVPARLGDAYRAYLLKKNAACGFTLTLGTIVAERAIELTVLVSMFALTAFLALQGRFSGATTGLIRIGVLLAAAIVVAILALWLFGSGLKRLLPSRAHAIYDVFREGTLGSFRRLPLLVLLTTVIWIMESGRLWFAAQSLGFPLALDVAIFVALANSLLSAFPLTPAGLGVVEAGVVGLLMVFVTKDQAVSITVLDRIISYWSIIFVGLALFLVTRRK